VLKIAGGMMRSATAIFSTPGDRPGGDTPVAAPGIVTVLSVLAHLAAATAAAWAVWPWWAAGVVTALCIAVIGNEQPRWRVLLRRRPTTAARTALEG
jgi:hypothetical protein